MSRIAVLFLLCLTTLDAQAIRRLAGFERHSIPRNDDGSSPLVTLPFPINFFGRLRTSGYVNNNGNITFDAALATYTPFGLDGTQREIIAAFFADVDTRGEISRLVTYGEDDVDNRKAFGINYFNVGYFSSHTDRLNTFQIVLIDRSDTGSGNFDVEFNYEKILWETGDASGGTGGLGGVPASVGWSNGSGLPGTSYELPGSLITGQFLDSGPRALARRRLNSQVIGRYIFRARDGMLSPGLTITSSTVLPPGVVGLPYLANFTASGGTNPYRWTMTPDPGAPLPGLSLNSAGVFNGTPTARGIYEFTASVSSRVDNVEETVSQRIAVEIEAPSLAIDNRACPLPDGLAGSPYSQTLRATGGGGPFLWAWGENGISPVPGLTLTESGVLSGIPSKPGSYNFLIRVAGPPASEARPGVRACTLNVRSESATPAIHSCPAESITVGVPYQSTAVASGGTAPWRWFVNGTLPLGITMDSSGRFSGIASVEGTYEFPLIATDATGGIVTNNCRLTVSPSAITISTPCPLPATATGDSFSLTLDADGGSGPYLWSISGTLPHGIRLGDDGRLSGSANEAGSWRFLISARDQNGKAGAKACALSVTRSALSIASCPLPSARVGQLYSGGLATIGGTAPLRWSNETPLPEGLTILSSGQIAGTPTQGGETEFRLRVTDSSGGTTTQTCRLFVQPEPLRILRDCPLPDATVGSYYREPALSKGGVSPHLWRVEGNLPTGLALGGGGVLAGTPRVPGRFPFTLILDDGRNSQMRQSCELISKIPRIPDLRIAIGSGASNIPVDLNLGQPYPLAITGDLVLTPEPNTGADAEANKADPAVQILPTGRRVRFEIPAGARTLRMRLSSAGTVASRYVFSIERLTIAGQEQSAISATATVEVARTAPQLQEACYSPLPNGYLNLRLTGQSSTRELRAMSLDLNGKSVTDTPIAAIAGEYFSSALSIRAGGAFQLEAPVLMEKDGYDVSVGSLSVRLINAVGASASRDVRRCN